MSLDGGICRERAAPAAQPPQTAEGLVAQQVLPDGAEMSLSLASGRERARSVVTGDGSGRQHFREPL